MLVGGGELHDTFDSLVRTERPLSRGIQRFTGITQAMVDSAPPPREVLEELGELLGGRVLVAHSARFDRRVLRQAFERCGLDWPKPPVLCTVQLARRFAPLSRSALAGARWPTRSASRSPRCTAPCRTRSPARASSARCSRACARTRRRSARRSSCSGRRRRARKTEPAERIPPSERPDLSTLPDDPGVYIFRDGRGRPLYVGKSVSLRSRARAHFCAPGGLDRRAEIVDYRPTNSELGALVLENRLIKQWKPAGNGKLKRTDRYCYLRCRLDIPYPVLEVASEPAAGHAVNVGRCGSRALAQELADQLTSLYRLRHCGRKLQAARAPVRLRADGALRVALPRATSTRTPTGASSTWRWRTSSAPAPASALLDELDRRMARGGRRPALRARGGAAAPARAAGLGAGAPRGRAARHPRGAAARAGAAPGQGALRRVLARARPAGRLGRAAGPLRARGAHPAALARPPGRTVVPADEVDESGSWRAGWPTTSRRAVARSRAERAGADALRGSRYGAPPWGRSTGDLVVSGLGSSPPRSAVASRRSGRWSTFYSGA